MVTAQVRFSNGECRVWRCLVDTGAMYSVVRPDVVPSSVWENARTERTFQTASGARLSGGQRGVTPNCPFAARTRVPRVVLQ